MAQVQLGCVGGGGVMTSPIETYLSELNEELPVSGRRVVQEIRAHLLETKERHLAGGATEVHAEELAVAEAGSVRDVVAAVERDGTPLLSPGMLRVAPWLAALFALPTLLFVFVNLIEAAAGNQGGEGVFGTAFDGWSLPIGLLLAFGPVAGFLVLLLSRSRLNFRQVDGGVDVSVRLRLKGWALALTVVLGLVVVGVVYYFLTENIFCIPASWTIC